MKVRVVNLRRTRLSRFAGEGAARARVVGLVCVFVLCTWAILPTRMIAADLHSLVVLSYPDRPAKLPLWLAQDAGLFQKYGVKVEIKPAKSGEDLVERIARDEAQIYVATANWIVSGIGDGKDLVFFANTGYSVLKLVARPILLGLKISKEKKSAPASQQQPRPDHASDIATAWTEP